LSSFFANITLVNNSSDTLTLDAGASNGLHVNDWPYQIPPKATLGPFTQGFNFQIKFNAVYANQAATSPQKPSVNLYMYGDAMQVFSTQITQNPNNPPPFPSSFTTVTGSTSATFTIG
jgi:hypothetical protein